MTNLDFQMSHAINQVHDTVTKAGRSRLQNGFVAVFQKADNALIGIAKDVNISLKKGSLSTIDCFRGFDREIHPHSAGGSIFLHPGHNYLC